MSELIQFLNWDTEFFGLKIGRILSTQLNPASLEKIIQLAQQEQYRCLYFQANPNDPETVTLAERKGFHLVDVRIVLEHPFDRRPAPVARYPISSEIMLRAPHPQEEIRLEEIAVEIGYTSRFSFDNRFPADAYRRLYRTWLHKSIANRKGTVIVACLSDQAVGFIACNICDDNVGMIELAGVQSGCRGQGVGTVLVQKALDWFRKQDLSKVTVVTQTRNVPAQRLYQQMGFFTQSMTLYYHKWFNE